MRPLTLIAGATLLVVAGSAAEAATLTGEVKTVDPHTRTISLWDGQTFKLARSVNVGQLRPNGVFDITYQDERGRMVATLVKPTSPWPRW
jgi:hypothetical protein